MPLSIAPLGQSVTIVQCNAKGDLKHHLENLGFLPGEVVMPLSENQGDLIVRVRESRLAINRGLAMKIFVK